MQVKHLELIGHSLGIDIRLAVFSVKKRDKKLPKEFYRNYFNSSKGGNYYHYLLEMVELGLMENFDPSIGLDSEMFRVTDKGIDAFEIEFNNWVKYHPKKDMSVDCLKNRINFYCHLYYYSFNADDVIADFNQYFLNNYYMSHTMTQTIGYFSNEMKRFSKAGKI